jgi:hypothetical protein
MTNSSDPTPSSAIFKLPFFTPFGKGELIEWLSLNGKAVLYSLVTFMALLFITYRFSSSNANQSEADYFKAANDFTLFSQSENHPDALKELLSLMNRHPELHAAYDGAIAQTLLNEGRIEEAKPLALSTFKRTESDAFSTYQQYAQISLLSSEKKFSEALEHAKTLQAQLTLQLEQNKDDSAIFNVSELFALNLLRIGMLQQELNDTAGELKTWQEWKVYAGLETNKMIKSNADPLAFRTIIQQLAQGTTSLPDYFTYRSLETVLKSVQQ